MGSGWAEDRVFNFKDGRDSTACILREDPTGIEI